MYRSRYNDYCCQCYFSLKWILIANFLLISIVLTNCSLACDEEKNDTDNTSSSLTEATKQQTELTHSEDSTPCDGDDDDDDNDDCVNKKQQQDQGNNERKPSDLSEDEFEDYEDDDAPNNKTIEALLKSASGASRASDGAQIVAEYGPDYIMWLKSSFSTSSDAYGAYMGILIRLSDNLCIGDYRQVSRTQNKDLFLRQSGFRSVTSRQISKLINIESNLVEPAQMVLEPVAKLGDWVFIYNLVSPRSSAAAIQEHDGTQGHKAEPMYALKDAPKMASSLQTTGCKLMTYAEKKPVSPRRLTLVEITVVYGGTTGQPREHKFTVDPSQASKSRINHLDNGAPILCNNELSFVVQLSDGSTKYTSAFNAISIGESSTLISQTMQANPSTLKLAALPDYVLGDDVWKLLGETATPTEQAFRRKKQQLALAKKKQAALTKKKPAAKPAAAAKKPVAAKPAAAKKPVAAKQSAKVQKPAKPAAKKPVAAKQSAKVQKPANPAAAAAKKPVAAKQSAVALKPAKQAAKKPAAADAAKKPAKAPVAAKQTLIAKKPAAKPTAKPTAKKG